jgi:hypothetical protein
MTIDLVIAVAKRMPVIRNERRRHRRITEVRVAGGIRGRSPGDVSLCCFEAVMITLLCDLSTCRGWRRWRVVRRRLRMRTSGKSKGKQQYCNREQSLHHGSSLVDLRPRLESALASYEGTPG